MNIFIGRITGFNWNFTNGTKPQAQSKNRYLMINQFKDTHMRIAPGIGACANDKGVFYLKFFQ